MIDRKMLGQIVATSSVADLTSSDDGFKNFVSNCFNRYVNSDWGELDPADSKMNDLAVASGEDRILASYNFPENAPWKAISSFERVENKIWIITEHDHKFTTILFPSEY